MNHKKINSYIFMLLIGVYACQSPDAPDCLKSAGLRLEKPVIRMLDGSINSVELRQNIRLTLVPDSVEYVEIDAPANLIPKIVTTLQGSNLIIKNENRCNWVRSYDHVPHVIVHLKTLRYLRIFGFGQVDSRDTLRGHALDILHYGASQVNLPVRYYSLFYDGDHVGTAAISGILEILYFSSQKFNQFSGERLFIKRFEGIHKSERDAFIRCRDSLTVVMQNTGNLKVIGRPHVNKKIQNKGTVQLIDE